jgi:hypothetical protein
MTRRWRLAIRLTAGALVWALGVVLAALLLPAFNGQTMTSELNGVTLTTATFVQVNGAWVLIPVAAPAVVTVLVAVALRARRANGPSWVGPAAWAAIALVLVLALVTIASIGAIMLPVVVLLVLALRLVPTATDRTRHRELRPNDA